MSTLYNFAIPEGWTLIQSGVAHPSDEFAKGDLCRFDSTGRYCLFCGQVARNVPQPWARKLDPSYTDGRLLVDQETRETRARKGAAARWGRCQIQTRISGQWTADGIGNNPWCTLSECRASIDALRGLIAEDPQWAGEYRIVGEDGGVLGYWEL